MWTKPQQKIIVHVFLARNINARTIYYDDFYPSENDQKHKIFAWKFLLENVKFAEFASIFEPSKIVQNKLRKDHF